MAPALFASGHGTRSALRRSAARRRPEPAPERPAAPQNGSFQVEDTCFPGAPAIVYYYILNLCIYYFDAFMTLIYA